MAASVNMSTLQTGPKAQESAQLYRQAENSLCDCIFRYILQCVMPKNIPSEALSPLTVYVISTSDKIRYTVSHTVISEANPAIDRETCRDIFLINS